MFSRPAFLDRLPDLTRLRGQIVALTASVACTFALLFVLAASGLDARRSAERSTARAEALARGAAVWLDGDAHAGLGSDPAKRLGDLGATLEQLAQASGHARGIRTLRPRESSRAALAAHPEKRDDQALEVVLQTGSKKRDASADYLPEMAPALLEGQATVARGSSGLVAYAPIVDSWGTTTAIVAVESSSGGPLWRRVVFLVASCLFAGALCAVAIWLADRYARVLGTRLQELVRSAHVIASGDWSLAVNPARGPRELTAMAETLESLRARLQASALGEPLPPLPEPLNQAGAARRPRASLGEPAEFDLALLTQQIAEPARKFALSRGLDFQLVFPEGTPSRLHGHPVALYQVLDALVRNAFRMVEHGSVSLRIGRASESADGSKLLFEVADTGPGITFKDQQELTLTLTAASDQDPATLKEPLSLASALVRALGGELGFESQPGQGSRFGFTLSFQAPGQRPDAATRFLARRLVKVG